MEHKARSNWSDHQPIYESPLQNECTGDPSELQQQQQPGKGEMSGLLQPVNLRHACCLVMNMTTDIT